MSKVFLENYFPDENISKFLPYNNNSPVSFNMGKTKSLLLVQTKEPLLITIDNKNITDAFKNQFETLWNQETQVYKGLDAVKNIFNEVLDSEDLYILGGRGYLSNKDPVFANDWLNKINESEILIKVILNPEDKNHPITTISNTKIKYNLPKTFSDNNVFWIYNHKVVLLNWADKEPLVIIIENKLIYEMYKKQFDTLWNQDIVTHSGQENIENFYELILDEAKSDDEFILFVTKPTSKIAANYNIDFIKKLVKKIKRVRFIYYGNTRENIQRADELRLIGCEVKIIDTNENLPVSTMVVGDNIVIIIWDEEPQVIKYKNNTVANSYRQNFNLLWNKN
jgi:hypothetical protein